MVFLGMLRSCYSRTESNITAFRKKKKLDGIDAVPILYIQIEKGKKEGGKRKYHV